MFSRPATLVIAIGADAYRSDAFSALPGARIDIEIVRKFFIDRGLPATNIRILAGEQATRAACISALRVWPRGVRAQELDIFFFYSGHGLVVTENGSATSVLLTVDTDPEDIVGTGLPISDVAVAISRTKPSRAFFFVDACEVGGPSGGSMLESGLLAGVGNSLSFGLFAAPGKQALEPRAIGKGGLFTGRVLAAMSSETPLTCLQVSTTVASELNAINAPTPEIVFRGNGLVYPMERLAGGPIPRIQSAIDTVLRPGAGRALVASLSMGLPVWVWGPSGRGKTSLVGQLAFFLGRPTATASVPTHPAGEGYDLEAVLQVLATQLADQAPGFFPSGTAPVDGFLGVMTRLRKDDSTYLPVIDHLDRLDDQDRRELISLSIGVGSGPLVLVCRTPPAPPSHVIAFEAPSLTEADVDRFSAQYATGLGSLSSQELLLMCQGSPLQLRNLLAGELAGVDTWLGSNLSHDELRALRSIRIAGGFLDVVNFCDIMKLHVEWVYSLLARGLIQLVDDCYVPHDSVMAASTMGDPSQDRQRAASYWCFELATARSLPRASRGIAQLLGAADRDLTMWAVVPAAIRDLLLTREWQLIDAIAGVLLAGPLTRERVPAALEMAQIYVHSVRHKTAAELMLLLQRNASVLDSQQTREVAVLESERLWWYGEFHEALAVLNASKSGEVESTAGQLSRGIAHWFLGEWRAADGQFESVVASDDGDQRVIGWGQIMLASSLGLRGVSIPRMRSLFGEGISRLARTGDDIGVAVGWGNFGEISWKLSEFPNSNVQLQRALLYARRVCGPQLTLEIVRSVIECALRQYGPWSQELDEAMEEAERLYEDSMGPTAQMQYWNTLATVALMRGDSATVSTLLECLLPITVGNSEYHIYTLANRALYRILSGDLIEAKQDMSTALSIANVAGNPLAAKQVIDNTKMMSGLSLGMSEGQLQALREMYEAASSD